MPDALCDHMPPSSGRNLTRSPLHTARGLLIEYPSSPYALKLRVANDSNTRIRHTKSNPAETLVLKQMLERTSADALPVTRNLAENIAECRRLILALSG